MSKLLNKMESEYPPIILDNYVTFIDAAFSPNTEHIVLADDLNRLITLDLLQRRVTKRSTLPAFLVSIKTIGNRLIGCRSDSGLCVFAWDQFTNIIDESGNQRPLIDDAHQTPYAQNCSAVNFVEALTSKSIVIGSRNGEIRVVNVEANAATTIISTKGHESQINSLAATSESTFVSAGSDGVVRSWDIRTDCSTATQQIEVAKNPSVAREEFGSDLSCMSICGGGPQMGVWHLPSSKLVNTIKDDRTTQTEWHALELNSDENTFLCGGRGPDLYVFNFTCEQQTTLPIELEAIGVIRRKQLETNSSLTVVAGESSKVHFVMNEGYTSAIVDTRL
ncbi:THO complex subunit 6-like protein [Aphelenchoides besseyi]|nr:THO complex subunit 6-like protein [Aphelenchoides besseyi]KAI6211547.1 THO complex subunit 6-like protein [Aphelenchoides besseyi]